MNKLINSIQKKYSFQIFNLFILCLLALSLSCQQNKPSYIQLDAVENPPVHPNCANLTTAQTKRCFRVAINEFIIIEFNSEVLADNTPASQRLNVAFVVDENGAISNIEVTTPYKEVKEEVTRLLNKIPTMKPASQNGKDVAVQCSFPLIFQIKI